MSEKTTVLRQLMAVIQDRKANPPPRSYTTRLLAGGVSAISDKILEEAREVTEAARESEAAGREHLIHETADLIYHVCVLLGHQSIRWEDIETELAARFGICGLDEKAAREQQ